MGRKFTEFAFTPQVRAAQELNSSREANQALETIAGAHDVLTEREVEFIQSRDSFYQASVGENGWPYVQFRGGTTGFLRVLDNKTLGYTDFRGNAQYISLGNLQGNDRVAMIMVDYANRRRLKIWARANIISIDDNPELIARLEMTDYRAEIQRGIVLTVEAYDWNCPQHITPRYTKHEVEASLHGIAQRIATLETENRQLKNELEKALSSANAIGGHPEGKT